MYIWLHGYKILYRVIWLVICVVMATFALIAAISLLDKYNDSSVVYEMEVDDGTWESVLPAFAICSNGVPWNKE